MKGTNTATTLIKMLIMSTGDRKKEVIDEFEQKFHLSSAQIRDKKNPSHITCPGCLKQGHIVQYGYADRNKTRKRFHCKSCSRHFNDHTDTLFHNKKLRKHLLPFLEMMLNGISVRKTAENLEFHQRPFIHGGTPSFTI